MWNRFGAWLLTDAGKKCAYLAAGTGATAAMLAHTLPHSMCLKQYKDFMQLYKNGFSVPLTPQLQETFKKALELTGIDSKDRHLYQPFSAYGFDIFSAGSSYSHFGVIIGLPANFFYQSVAAIDKHLIKIHDNSICWELDEAKMYAESLVLSEDAKLYAIAREIKFRSTIKPLLDAAFAVVSITGAYGLANGLNTRLHLYARPRPLRLILYAMVGAFTFGSYALCKDCTQVYYENRIDKELAEQNPIFVKGGLEYYTKKLKRNMALRKLLGKEGESLFSVMGNENAFIRYKHIPIVQRKTNFEQLNNEQVS